MSKKVNHIILNDELQIDLRNDTVTPETLVSGVTAHDKSGEIIEGTLALPSGTVVLPANGRYDVTNFEFADVALPAYDKTVEVQGATQEEIDIYLNPQGTIPYARPNEYLELEDPYYDYPNYNCYEKYSYYGSNDRYYDGEGFPNAEPSDLYYSCGAAYLFTDNNTWAFMGYSEWYNGTFQVTPLLETINGYPVTCISGYKYNASSVSTIPTVFIPHHIIEIESFDAYYINYIVYDGTMEEWNAINKANGWLGYSSTVTVYCTDGTVIETGS